MTDSNILISKNTLRECKYEGNENKLFPWSKGYLYADGSSGFSDQDQFAKECRSWLAEEQVGITLQLLPCPNLKA